MTDHIHLQYVNVHQDHSKPLPDNFRMDLHSHHDNKFWTIQAGMSEELARQKLSEFSEFSGLPKFWEKEGANP